MRQDPGDSEDLLHRAAADEEDALAALWQRHRARLRQMVRLRLDRRLQGRVDPSDVLQEAYLDLAARLPDYAHDRPMPTYLWLRLVTGQRLGQIHRQHLGAAMRDAGREVSLYRGDLPQASAASLAARLQGRFATASQAAVRAERQFQLQAILNGMEPLDREILALRHFEGLSNGESAAVLGPVQDRGQRPLRPCPGPTPRPPGARPGLLRSGMRPARFDPWRTAFAGEEPCATRATRPRRDAT
jgi:RNA polymerase sigma-70 factor (ECF subfamily)